MAVTYDESVIVSFAERLYRRAASMVAAYALFGALVSALIGVGLGFAIKTPELIKGIAVVVGLLGTVIGAMVGSERAFTLRLLAQQALCQVQIERNTRAQGAIRASASQPIAPPRQPTPPPLPDRRGR
jgi:hypothetical protein